MLYIIYINFIKLLFNIQFFILIILFYNKFKFEFFLKIYNYFKNRF